jgi:hypothetical protein
MACRRACHPYAFSSGAEAEAATAINLIHVPPAVLGTSYDWAAEWRSTWLMGNLERLIDFFTGRFDGRAELSDQLIVGKMTKLSPKNFKCQDRAYRRDGLFSMTVLLPNIPGQVPHSLVATEYVSIHVPVYAYSEAAPLISHNAQ